MNLIKLTGKDLVVRGQDSMCNFIPLTVNNILCDFYSINEYGNIRSKKSGKILKPKKNKNGYLVIALCVNEIEHGKTHKRKMFSISQLVARTYIGKPPDYMKDPTVDHIDSNINNNHFTNLRWLERGINSSIRKNKGVGSQNHEAKLTEAQVKEICNLLINTNLSFQQIADKFNVDKSTINNIKQHKTWKNITTKYDFSCRTMTRDIDGRFKPMNINLIK